MLEYPLVSLIILNHNGRHILRSCIESVLKTEYPRFEILLVDNASTDGSIEEIEDLYRGCSNLKIIKNDIPLFCAGGFNTGIKHARGDYIVFLNNDVEFDTAWLKELVDVFRDNEIGAAQPKIMNYYHREIIDHAGGEVDLFGFGFGRGHNKQDRGQFDNNDEIFYASDIAMIIKSALLEKAGIFDDKFLFYCEDLDLSWRIRLLGYKIKFCPSSIVFHKFSKTVGTLSKREELSFHVRKNRITMLLKNYSLFNIVIFLPITLLMHLLIYLKNIFIDKNLSLANTTIAAIKWNFINIRYIIAQRKIVQKKIRRVKDNAITGKMHKIPLFLKYGIS